MARNSLRIWGICLPAWADFGTPAECQRPGNVSEEVIEDIAAWLKTEYEREKK